MKRTKHIWVQFYYSSDKYIKGEIDVKYVPTNVQLADPLTKPLSSDKFWKFKSYYVQIELRKRYKMKGSVENSILSLSYIDKLVCAN